MDFEPHINKIFEVREEYRMAMNKDERNLADQKFREIVGVLTTKMTMRPIKMELDELERLYRILDRIIEGDR